MKPPVYVLTMYVLQVHGRPSTDISITGLTP